MSALKAARCDQCGKVESCKEHRPHPEDWWTIYGPAPTTSLDFCSRACLTLYFHPAVLQMEVTR